MFLLVQEIPASCSEQDIRSFLEKELGRYAKEVKVYEVGTQNAYATVDLDEDKPYVGEVIAQQVQGKLLGGAAVKASVNPFGDHEAAPKA